MARPKSLDTGVSQMKRHPRWLLALTASALLFAACGGSSLSADAGTDFSVSVGEAPVFDACNSEGEIANYAWSIISAPEGRADDVGKALRATMNDCSFELESAMLVDDLGDWTIELTVTNGEGSDSDQVTVEVTE